MIIGLEFNLKRDMKGKIMENGSKENTQKTLGNLELRKKYRTLEEMCLYLETEKKIFDASRNKDLLVNRSYVSVINPYKRIFASGEDINRTHKYEREVSILEYEKLVYLDDLFSLKYHKIIGDFERKLKLEITNALCKHMYTSGDIFCIEYVNEFARIIQSSKPINEIMPYNMLNVELEYFKRGIYPLKNQNLKVKRIGLMEKIIYTATSQIHAKNSILSHYQRHYPVIPFWITLQILSFGEALILFNMLSIDDRNEIAKILTFKNNVNYNDSVSFSKHLQRILALRNIINHYEPAFPFFYNYTNRQELLSTFRILNLYDEQFTYKTLFDFDAVNYRNNYNKDIIVSLEIFMKLL